MGQPVADHLIVLHTDRLQPGMFVAKLDRLWLNTPFPPDGFQIADETQIRELQRYCSYVYVDPRRGRAPPEEPVRTAPTRQYAVPGGSLHAELPAAAAAMEKLRDSVAGLLKASRTGKLASVRSLRRTLNPMVDTIRRCPDAALWVLRTGTPGPYLYRRAAGTGIISAVAGRHLGLDRYDLMDLLLGGILLDIGKVEVPVPILAKCDMLTDREIFYARRHVKAGVHLLRLMQDVPDAIFDMVSGHHERLDGTGYPHHRQGDEIPLFARLAGIVDTFDALTLDRRYAAAMSSRAALQYMKSECRTKFDAGLLGEFANAMGIWPTGTWVELTDGSIGIVCAQDTLRPLAPRVVIVSVTRGTLSRPFVLQPNRLNPIKRSLHSPQGRVSEEIISAVGETLH